MKEHIIYAETVQGFNNQFNKFLESNPGIAVQRVYAPEEDNRKNEVDNRRNWDQADLSGVIFKVIYE